MLLLDSNTVFTCAAGSESSCFVQRLPNMSSSEQLSSLCLPHSTINSASALETPSNHLLNKTAFGLLQACRPTVWDQNHHNLTCFCLGGDVKVITSGFDIPKRIKALTSLSNDCEDNALKKYQYQYFKCHPKVSLNGLYAACLCLCLVPDSQTSQSHRVDKCRLRWYDDCTLYTEDAE